MPTNNDPIKQKLRRYYQEKRQQLSAADQLTASNRVCSRILTLNDYHQATHIGLYHAVRGEIDLSFLRLKATLENKIYYYPIMNPDRTLSFLPVTADTLFSKNSLGINEPLINMKLAVPPDTLDILFLPLVAFDDHGTRLGMGGGYYDRTLATLKPKHLVGVAYDFQHEAFINRESWDVPLSVIITESHTYWSKPCQTIG